MRFLTVNRAGKIAALLSASVLLVACSEPWKAPYESRSSIKGRQYAPVISSQAAPPEKNVATKGSPVATYTVKPDDTLYSIGRSHGVSPEQIIEWNGMYTTRIRTGQKLVLSPPVSGSADKEKQSSETPTKQTTKKQSIVATQTKSNRTKDVIPKAAEKKAGGLRWRWPVKGKMTQGFSASDPSRKGIKIKGSEGRVVRAAEGGTIVYSGDGLVGYGELIIIKHNKEYLSAYAYNRKRLVKEGDKVKRGAAVAEMGVNGGEALLHFEIRRQGKPVNPMAYLP
ncbi:membrane-bound metallopeptidase [Solemya velum gill symbiont]|uniref:Membrane-bound metallopeptidase n=1 Tax=Solemya velum gill symbiont TaxID=2340 RepID=A0A0B0H9G5_SOVGS|nr:peptidoglycan DD-metalloendopeptidase family protein [Solemya velum gill symbiont]KHF25287.1 membrane-bound metallopeptidase [Solemya velum gill symbiont]